MSFKQSKAYLKNFNLKALSMLFNYEKSIPQLDHYEILFSL